MSAHSTSNLQNQSVPDQDVSNQDASDQSTTSKESTSMPQTSSATDFDFFIGDWRVQHRRLRERLADCDDWVEFEGACCARSLLGGAGNVDDNLLEMPDGAYRAVSLRSFDTETRRWSIWWLDGRTPHRLDPPVVGGFDGAVATFYADDVFNGTPIRVRFLWHIANPEVSRWEQAFSQDGGETWETNWVMVFSR
jgi:hypothetical protein